MAVGTVADFRFKLRYDTDANWTTQNPVLEEGEPGVNSDDYSLKLGDGITPWNDLPYVTENTVSGAVASATAAATAAAASATSAAASAELVAGVEATNDGIMTAVDADPGRRLDPRVAGLVAAGVDLHSDRSSFAALSLYSCYTESTNATTVPCGARCRQAERGDEWRRHSPRRAPRPWRAASPPSR